MRGLSAKSAAWPILQHRLSEGPLLHIFGLGGHDENGSLWAVPRLRASVLHVVASAALREGGAVVALTPEEMRERMEAYMKKYARDPEAMHSAADDLMELVLRQLDYEDAMNIYASMEKWYE